MQDPVEVAEQKIQPSSTNLEKNALKNATTFLLVLRCHEPFTGQHRDTLSPIAWSCLHCCFVQAHRLGRIVPHLPHDARVVCEHFSPPLAALCRAQGLLHYMLCLPVIQPHLQGEGGRVKVGRLRRQCHWQTDNTALRILANTG